MRLRARAIGILASLALLATACGQAAAPQPAAPQQSAGGNSSGSAAPAQAKPLKVAFIEGATAQQSGWNAADKKTADYIKANIPGAQVTFVESVPADPSVVPVIEKLVADGNKVIFADEFGYQDFTKQVAQAHPDVVFINQQATFTLPNMSSAYGKLEEGRYVEGIVAGLMTKSNIIGFVGAYSIPPVIIGINAFAIAARSVNPKATVKVAWVNSWYDPPKETEAANALLNGGADIIAAHADDPATLEAAAAHGKYGMTSNGFFQDVAPKAFLTGTVFNWNTIYSNVVKQAQSGSFKSAFLRGNLKDGTIELLPYGSAVPQDVKDKADKAKQGIEDGSLDIWKGPLKDNTGKEVVAAGKTLTQEQQDSMKWLVEGVQGTVQ